MHRPDDIFSMLYRFFNSQKEELAERAKTDIVVWFEYNFKYNSGRCSICGNPFLEMDKDEDIERHFKGECNDVGNNA